MNIQKEIDVAFPELVELKRYLHRHPELSEKEFHTMDFIEEKLKGWGIPFVRVPHGGVLGFINEEKEGFTVLLRADIDALPIQEDPVNLVKEKVCLSENPGVMHACGHDGHMAMQLMAGKILNEHKAELPGKVVLLFEEGEENGSRCILQLHKYLDDHQIHIDVCYGTHVRWDIPAGKVTILPHSVMSGAFGYQIGLTGKGGHGSRPDLSVNPVDCFVAFYQAMQTIRMQQISPEDCLTCSVGCIQCGEVGNVIPDRLIFKGTCRFFEEESGQKFQKLFFSYLESECRRCGCTWDIIKSGSSFPVVNDPVCTDIAVKAVAQALGEDALYAGSRWMASESMAYTLARWPGVFAFTGIKDDEVGSGANHHTAKFDIGEKGLKAGLGTALAYTVAMLKEQPKLSFTPRQFEA